MSKRSSWRRSIRPRGHERLRKYMIGHSKQDPLQSPWPNRHRGRLGGRVSPLGASVLRRAQYPLAFRSVPMNVPLRKVFGHSGWMNGEAGSTVDAEATDDVPAGVVERHAAAERDGEVP